MVRRIVPLALATAALAACQGQRGPRKSGPTVAVGDGVVVTVDEYKARLNELSPPIKARFTTLERKKEFLDGLVRFEVLAAEADRRGLYDDPDVQNTVRRMMVNKLVQRYFQEGADAKNLPESELRDYYEKNKAEFQRPARVRLAVVSFLAPPGAPQRAAKAAAARKAAAEIQSQVAKNPFAFGQLAQKLSEDEPSRGVGGDLGFRSIEELSEAYGPQFAAAVFGQKDNTVAGPIESTKGYHVVRVAGRQEEINRPFEQVKEQLAGRLFREKKQKDLEAWVKQLTQRARVKVDDAALEKIAVEAETGVPGPMGMGMPPGMPPTGPAVRPPPGMALPPPRPPVAPARP